MDAEKRKQNDGSYDWWSAEGEHKLIRFDFPTKRGIAMANQWHEYFLWRPIAEKVHSTSLFGSWTGMRAMPWYYRDFYGVFFEPLFHPYSGWGRDIESYSDAKMYEEMVQYTIMYERAIDSTYLKELGEIQDECEDLVGQMGTQLTKISKANEKLCALLPFGKAEARQVKEEAERKLLQLREKIDPLLARVDEIRAIVLER